MPSVIAVDAMGSDKAPRPEVDGALQAARHYGVRVLLVGREPLIRAELGRHSGVDALPLEIVHASEVIEMNDVRAASLRLVTRARRWLRPKWCSVLCRA
jgi:phosphate acyltransferase